MDVKIYNLVGSVLNDFIDLSPDPNRKLILFMDSDETKILNYSKIIKIKK